MPDEEEVPSSFWWAASIIAAAVFFVVAICSWAFHWHWLPNLWFNYGWSSDKGNGPEAIQQTIVYALAAVLLIPPIRHAFAREFNKIHTKLDAHHEEAKADRLALHDKIDRVHEHLGIGEVKRGPQRGPDGKFISSSSAGTSPTGSTSGGSPSTQP